MAGSLSPIAVSLENAFALTVTPTTYTVVRTLAADVSESVTVPTGAKYAIFGASGTFAARYNATVSGAAPSFADDNATATIEINPTTRFLKDVAEITLITKGDVYVSITFYK